MGDTIDNGGRYPPRGPHEIGATCGPPENYRRSWIYIVDQPSSVRAGVNSSGLGHPSKPYEITVSAKVLNILIDEMTVEERQIFARDPTTYQMRGQVLCRLVEAGKLHANGMWLVVGEEMKRQDGTPSDRPVEATGEPHTS